MGVDLHRIGFGISSGTSRNGFGNIVSFPSVVSGFPPYGTLISTQNDIEYTSGTSASYVNEETLDTYYVLNQTHDVYVRADGSGGTYLDEYEVIDSVTYPYDVKYKANGVLGATETYTNYITIGGSCTSSTNYPNGTVYVGYYHDGSGSMYGSVISYSYATFGYSFFAEECTDGEGNTYTTTYYSDNAGSYYT